MSHVPRHDIFLRNDFEGMVLERRLSRLPILSYLESMVSKTGCGTCVKMKRIAGERRYVGELQGQNFACCGIHKLLEIKISHLFSIPIPIASTLMASNVFSTQSLFTNLNNFTKNNNTINLLFVKLN